ncbi:MAG: rod-binding protein [Thermoclostridium sp.]|nr:rod-binding protein [Thermoclostridium sp.]
MKIEGMGSADITNSINRRQVQQDQAFEDILKKAYSNGDKEKLKEACKEFEGLLLQMMYKQMKKTVPESELLPASSGREIFQEMLDEKLIDNATQRGIGISEVLYRQLSINMDKTYVVAPEKGRKE